MTDILTALVTVLASVLIAFVILRDAKESQDKFLWFLGIMVILFGLPSLIALVIWAVS